MLSAKSVPTGHYASALLSDGPPSSPTGPGLPRSTSVNWPKMVPTSPGCALPSKPGRLGSEAGGYSASATKMPYFGVADERPVSNYRSSGVKKSSIVSQHTSTNFVPQFYTTVREIGQGSFGTALLVRDRRTLSERVCKEVVFRDGCCDKPQQVLEFTVQEIQLLADLDHPHIVKLHEFSYDLTQSRIVFVMEYLDCGDSYGLLRNFLTQPGKQEHLVGQVISQILIALAYCHGHNVLHRDIKPDNILLKRAGRGDVACKLVDFGLAVRGQQSTGEFVGSPSYFSPEVVMERHYTSKSDVWALGIVGVELLSGQSPFGRYKQHKGDIKQLFRLITKFQTIADFEQRLQHLPIWHQRSSEFDQCVGQLLQNDPKLRLDAKTAAAEPWCERHRPAPTGLTRQILQSLANYAGAPPPARCCLLAIAVRCNVPDQEAFGSAFLAADVDGDGLISHEDLSIAVERARNWWDPDINTTNLVNMADLDHSGGLSYSEFVAACLYDGEGSLDQLAEDAFTALDDDRDDMVWVRDVRRLFPELDTHVLRQLPEKRGVSRMDWHRCFAEACATLGGIEPRNGGSLNCGADFITLRCVQDTNPSVSRCQDIIRINREFSTESECGPPSRPRRLKKGSVECWGFSCAADDD